MRADLPEILPLICLGCRNIQPGNIDLASLMLDAVWRASGDEILDGMLRCRRCQRVYPIIDGVPVIVADQGGFFQRDLGGLVDPDAAPELAALLAEPGPDDTVLSRQAETLSVYLDSGWGDRASPAPDGPGAPHMLPAVYTRMAARASERVGVAIELGCGVGRGVLELARGADLVVGLDISLSSLRRARRLLAGQELRYPRRVSGRHYAPAVTRGEAAAGRVALICADAQDPPLPPDHFDRVAALNLVDIVPNPGQVLAVLTRLCATRGELIMCSPYAWQSGHVTEGERVGRHEPHTAIVSRLAQDGFRVVEEENLGWTLRRDARSAIQYLVHYLRLSLG